MCYCPCSLSQRYHSLSISACPASGMLEGDTGSSEELKDHQLSPNCVLWEGELGCRRNRPNCSVLRRWAREKKSFMDMTTRRKGDASPPAPTPSSASLPLMPYCPGCQDGGLASPHQDLPTTAEPGNPPSCLSPFPVEPCCVQTTAPGSTTSP